ncbi:MAG: beta-galactosidase [Burkholderiales bacterium]|nr:beta-galactosidase [Phycisphaerae bacterium]
MKIAAFSNQVISGCLIVGAIANALVAQESKPILDLKSSKITGIQCTWRTANDSTLRIEATGDGNSVLSITPDKALDLSASQGVRFTVRNVSKQLVGIRASVAEPDGKGITGVCTGVTELAPGAEGEVRVQLTRRPEDPGYETLKPFYMYFKQINVRDNTVDPVNIGRIEIAIEQAKTGQAIEVLKIEPYGAGKPGPVPFYPFIDSYGQYIHSDWPGKIYSDADFAANAAKEAEERKTWPGPADRDQYGGWANGPKLEATGFFRTVKHEGQWWFVDPEGRLFWSYGPTGVGPGGDHSPVNDREKWFAELPARDGPFGRFYRTGRGATYMYYQDRDWTGFDFAQANLIRKYGENYEQKAAELLHERLRSWGFNTMAAWSSMSMAKMHKTPYVTMIHYGSRMMHSHMPDVYEPNWEKNIRERMMKESQTTALDPWNIGYFVDNERWFGFRSRAAAIGEEALKNPPDAPVKLKFIEQLIAKYTSIDALNQAWATRHQSWEALKTHRQPPDMKNKMLEADCGDFGMITADRYFSVCRDAVKAAAPNHLYMGSRFHGHVDPEVVKLAAKYVDVVSYNIYDNPPESRMRNYRAIDVPFMVTEWGIGSDMQQMPFRGKDEQTQTPAGRAGDLTRYVASAIRHPNLVGAHFFQLRDQPISGRPDGEATLRGFLNVADTPNFQLVQANRAIAYDLYTTRAKAKP